jgi:hypothetical protein
MAIYKPDIRETIKVRDYMALCMELWQPYNPFHGVSDAEAIEDMLQNLKGAWSYEYVDRGCQYKDFFKVCRYGATERPPIYTCTLGVVNWEAGDDDAPTVQEIEAILPTITKELPESVYGILGNGDYWWGTLKYDFNFYDSVEFLDGDTSNPRICCTLHPVEKDEDGYTTNYSKILANFDVKFNWVVAE